MADQSPLDKLPAAFSARLSRRNFARVLTGSAAALAVPSSALAAESLQPAPGAPAPANATAASGLGFPSGFLWGSATASYQVEGAYKTDGRGLSIWDTFSHTPGKVHDGDTGDVADDFYHLFPKDIELMRSIGLKAFRFSVSWSRIFPTGTGQPNQKGVDFYSRLVDALLAAGIQPFCTLYHWDLPQALEDKGGWQNRDTAKVFGDYAGYIAGKLAPRVSHFMTTNEISTFVELGYRNGTHAPGLKLDAKDVAQVNHFAVLGHGMAVRAIRASAPQAQVGLAENPRATHARHRLPGAHRRRPHRAARRKRLLSHRHPGRPLHRSLPQAPRRRRAHLHARRPEDHQLQARLHRDQHLPACLCACGKQ